jgi:hypothetical protein
MHFKELDSFRLDDTVKFHDHLNPALYNGDHIKPDVREQLLLIAQDFIEHLGVNDLDLVDITVSGSNAAYNYTAHSDIDLHILVDIQQFENDDVYRELFDAKKTVYNENHDILINGYEVELYVQDSNEPVISLGEYSILNDKWIKLPRKRKADFDQVATKLKYRKLYKLAHYALKTNDSNKIQTLIRTLKKYRRAGLDAYGEFGPENLAFKALRHKGVIKELYEKLKELHDEQLSLPEDNEHLNKPTMNLDKLAQYHRVSKNYLMDQLMKGISIETEHTVDYNVAMEIALDHLKENPNYYVLLNKAGLEECSGYIPSKKEKNDSSWKTALTIDITPNSINEAVDTHTLDPNFKHQMKFGRYIYIATGTKGANTYKSKGYDSGEDTPGLSIEVFDPYNSTKNPIAYAHFIAHRDKSGNHWIESDMTRVEPDYRGQNIAYQIYAYAKMLGNDIKKNTDTDGELNQTELGKKMWRGWGKDNLNLYPDGWGKLIKEIDAKHPVKEASGYIPSNKEKNDSRFKTALTVDITPNSIKDNAKRLGSKVSRAGIPPLLRP